MRSVFLGLFWLFAATPALAVWDQFDAQIKCEMKTESMAKTLYKVAKVRTPSFEGLSPREGAKGLFGFYRPLEFHKNGSWNRIETKCIGNYNLEKLHYIELDNVLVYSDPPVE